MKLSILDEKRKTLNRVINTSVLSFSVLWLIIFILVLFTNEFTNKVTAYLMLISGLPLLTGLISLAGLAMSGNKFIEFNAQGEICLTLNLSEEDYKNHKWFSMGYSGNFITVPEHGADYEISSTQAKKLLLKRGEDNWKIGLQKRKTKAFTESPKEVFNTAMEMLWAAS